MKLFISWSGENSRKIAKELYEWFPMVLQSIEPYMSNEDIDKGNRWSTDLANELEESTAGIVILTPDNLASPWLHFEAGALSKIIDRTILAPVIFGLKPSEINHPLSLFQVTQFTSSDFLKLLKSINSVSPEPLPENRLEKTHEALWGKLSEKIEPLVGDLKNTNPVEYQNTDSNKNDALEKILTISRRIAAHYDNNLASNTDLIKPIIETYLEIERSSRPSPLIVLTEMLIRTWRDVQRASLVDDLENIDLPRYKKAMQNVDDIIGEMSTIVRHNRLPQMMRTRERNMRRNEIEPSLRSPPGPESNSTMGPRE